MVRTRTKSIGQEMTGKQLKNSILQWAIQGKLVPQDPNDEPASVLLERIREEKKRLIKEGKIKKDKNETIIYHGEDNSYYEKVVATGEVKCIDDEIPFEIPASWEWVRLGNIAEVIGGYAFPSQTLKGDIGTRVIRISDISEDGFINTRLVRYCGEPISDNYQIQECDILMAMTGGTVGKSLYVKSLPEEMLLNQRVAIIRNRYIVADFLNLVIKAPHIAAIINERKNSTNDNISMVDIYNFLIPIPCILQQTQIVEKYYKVLPLVNKYANAHQHAEVLNEAIKEKLRKSILQEAIQGRLVPQIPEEGTAQELLEQIRQEKARLMKEGKLKKSALSDSTIFRGDDNKYYEQVGSQVYVIEEDIPFDIPDSWCWMRLGCLVYCETGLAYSKDNLNDKSGSMIRVLRGGNIEEGRWSVKDDDVMIASKYVREELLLKRGTFITPAVTSLERMAKTALIETDLHDTVAGGFVLMLKPFLKYDAILEYLNLLFQTSYYKQYCVSITNKSGQAFYNLSRQKLMQCMIPIAPIKEMIRIVTKYESLDL